MVGAAAAAGHTVRAVSRWGGPSRAGVEHVVGDLGDAASYAEALDGADALFTLAGYAGLGGTLDALAPTGESLTAAEIRAEYEASMPQPYVEAFFQFYRGGLIDETTVTSDVESALGRPPRSFRDWVAANRDAFV